MALDITFEKRARETRVIIRRPGSKETQSFLLPNKGPVPHDVVHFHAERTLGLTRGFWGLIDQGTAPASVQQLAKDGGHASAARASEPDASIIELLQAERLVECFEADLWSGGEGDAQTFRDIYARACAASFVAPLVVLDNQLLSVRAELKSFASDWSSLPERHTRTLHWP